ncbi:hypothetical protein F5880DRAFT_1545396 [Lentinula raphanica]|nr:hypothetical protein F5880DRAFT_1545396 [Lentinula raphanica]
MLTFMSPLIYTQSSLAWLMSLYTLFWPAGVLHIKLVESVRCVSNHEQPLIVLSLTQPQFGWHPSQPGQHGRCLASHNQTSPLVRSIH